MVMGGNVLVDSLVIVVLCTVTGVVAAGLTFFISRLLGKVNKQDAELDKTRSLHREVYRVAIDALRGMNATTTLDLYKANYRAFRDAISDAETLKIESAGVWRAQALLDSLSHREQPNEEVKARIEKTEQELRRSLDILIDEEENGRGKKKQKPKKVKKTK